MGYDHESASAPDGPAVDAYSFSIGPNAYYDWRLPISTTAGDFVVSIEGGVIGGRAWIKIDQPFMPGSWERITAFGLRFASALQFRAHGGLVVSFQPLGVDIPLNHPTLMGNTMLTVTSGTAWEGALLCGYQFE